MMQRRIDGVVGLCRVVGKLHSPLRGLPLPCLPHTILGAALGWGNPAVLAHKRSELNGNLPTAYRMVGKR